MQLINDNLMPIMGHLQELRKRLIISVIAFLIASCVAYLYAENIYNYLTLPLAEASGNSNRKLIFTGLTEAFFTYVKLSCFAGFIISFPIVATQLYFFIAPGLYRKEKGIVLPYLIASPVLFLLGAMLVYYYVMPLAWKFFIGFETIGANAVMPMVLEARVSEYLALVISLIMGFGLAFQMPVVLVLLAQVGVVQGSWLAEKRRFAIVVIFILAAILTPPDVISQIALAIPLLLLYEISIIICKRIEKNRV
jgi:sec-independent protein translocase protein TatC